MSTYCINGRPKLSLTQCFPMEKLSRKNIAFSPSMQFIFEKPYYLTNMSRWPSGLRHRQIILATKVAWVRSPVPPKISFLNLIFYLAPEWKGCNFIAPQALIQQLYYQYFILLLNYRAIFDTSAQRSDAHVLKGYIKNCSIVML